MSDKITNDLAKACEDLLKQHAKHSITPEWAQCINALAAYRNQQAEDAEEITIDRVAAIGWKFRGHYATLGRLIISPGPGAVWVVLLTYTRLCTVTTMGELRRICESIEGETHVK